jgi:hypothetical protein
MSALTAGVPGVLVSAEQARAAAADIYDGEDAAMVQVDLAGSILSVSQGDSGESYDIDGAPVEYPPLKAGTARPALVLTAGQIKRAAAEAVARCGARCVLLSQPLDGAEQHGSSSAR